MTRVMISPPGKTVMAETLQVSQIWSRPHPRLKPIKEIEGGSC
jgi:hypothetical protein